MGRLGPTFRVKNCKGLNLLFWENSDHYIFEPIFKNGPFMCQDFGLKRIARLVVLNDFQINFIFGKVLKMGLFEPRLLGKKLHAVKLLLLSDFRLLYFFPNFKHGPFWAKILDKQICKGSNLYFWAMKNHFIFGPNFKSGPF